MMLWDSVINVFHGSKTLPQPLQDPSSVARGDSSGVFDVDFVSSTVNLPTLRSHLYIMEDNEATIKMLVKGRSPTMAHVPRTHRVDLDWTFELFVQNPDNTHLRFVSTKSQIADMFTKGSFNATEWSQLQTLAAICCSSRIPEQSASVQFLLQLVVPFVRGDSRHSEMQNLDVVSGMMAPSTQPRQPTLLAKFVSWINIKCQCLLLLAGFTTEQLGMR